MPIYAYRCATCGHAQDVLQKISDPLLTVCPNCGAPTLVKQVTAAGFQLKGSGWYVTDFREGSKTKPEGGTDKSDKADAAPADAAKAGKGGKETAKESGKSVDASTAAPAPAPVAAPSAAPVATAPAATPSGKTGS